MTESTTSPSANKLADRQPMKHHIDPTVDCVFKAVLGSADHTDRLRHFLNAVLKSSPPIASVEILNPYNEREFLSDKLTIVDVKALDEADKRYQVEIQLVTHSYLKSRMLYTWSDIYRAQLKSGLKYDTLKPVISIWLLLESLFPDEEAHHLHFQVIEPSLQLRFSDHFSLHVLALDKWHKQAQEGLSPEDYWLLFFKEAKTWDKLPDFIEIPELESAMETLKRFSEKEKNYHLYQARMNAIREEHARQLEWENAKKALEKMEAARQKSEVARQKSEAARQEAEAQAQKAEAETAKLRQKMIDLGIDPDAV